ncbi:C69 family dipeptidase [Lutimaribacter sp. EGI FJ00015]|uniref:C69 family dipeptidase n=1 Tax=Lutimaribacter degradans TaxID=2945989 RepID=A0ACC6A140_9RHOB|nr:C69 family dipeptidase [Lutimaribacter sp. EGI FJ00013]MCM2563324.1 C69 family dipeptidase [Lutimaribacter sp. EGI FJ00013]MCO0614599.1 C69 family dipeptidase [Lutimaribacter sp. EGI FJ00015]MCO0637270.1 C69 family dipeptidase [Lutimaribacter sp. EGI FJ00014]
MSYGIYIGRNLTADGVAYMAGYGDEPSSHWLEINPRAIHRDGSTVTVGVTPQADMPGHLSEIPQAPQTLRNMRVNYSYYLGVPAPLTNGGLNECGVAVRDIWSTSRDDVIAMTPKDQSGPNYSDLARLVVERAHSAREGVELIGRLIAEHGYSTYGGNSHMIADPDEAWVVIEFAGGRGLWCAERLGPDDIRASRPGYIGEIPEAPNEDFLFPAHFFDTAREMGWWSPEDGPFHVNHIYGDGKHRWDGVAWIEDEMRKRAQRPGKIALEDVFWSISTDRLTGDTAGYGQVVPLTHPAHDALRMMWHAAVGPVTAPLMPVFLGQSSVPPAWQQHRYLTTGESHRFLDCRKKDKDPDTVSLVPQGIESGISAFHEFKRLMHLAFQKPDPILAEVWTHWRAIEARTNAEVPDVLRAASLLLDANEQALASQVLTEFSHARFAGALAECRALADAAHARLSALNALNMTATPLSPDQIW